MSPARRVLEKLALLWVLAVIAAYLWQFAPMLRALAGRLGIPF